MKPEHWIYEDELPELTDEEFREAFAASIVDGVRMYPESVIQKILAKREKQAEVRND